MVRHPSKYPVKAISVVKYFDYSVNFLSLDLTKSNIEVCVVFSTKFISLPCIIRQF